MTYAPDLLSKINIVTTDSYRTPGKGLSHTLLDAQRALPDSFVFHACDSLLFPAGANCTRLLSDTDQVFMAKTVHAGIYRTLTQEAGRHVWRHEWQPKESDAYVGICHVSNVEDFWIQLARHADSSPEGGETCGLNLETAKAVSLPPETWLDIGSPEGLAMAQGRDPSAHTVLPKPNEAIWFRGSEVIKFHREAKFIEGRVARAKVLHDVTPSIERFSTHAFVYKKIDGMTLSRAIETDAIEFKGVLTRLADFWFADHGSQILGIDASETNFMQFYREKTYSRVSDLIDRFPTLAHECNVNGVRLPNVWSALDSIDWAQLAIPIWGRVHGDLHPDNILVRSDGTLAFVDWRQDIAGSHGKFGDVAYDLAKLAHGLRVDHHEIFKGNYSVQQEGPASNVVLSLTWPKAKQEAYSSLFDQVHEFGVTAEHLKLLESLIYLNIAPLHEPDSYAEFLSYLGRYSLHHSLSIS